MAKLGITWENQFHGPRPFATEPVVVASLLAEGAVPAGDVIQAAKRLNREFPFSERLDALCDHDEHDGLLLLGKVAADWALGLLTEVRGHLQASGAMRDEQSVKVWLGYHNADVSRQALQMAVGAIHRGLLGKPLSSKMGKEVDDLTQVCRRLHPDYQARILMLAADEMQVPYLPLINLTRFWQFGWGEKGQIFLETGSNYDGGWSNRIARDKVSSKALMRSLGVKTPDFKMVSTLEELEKTSDQLGYPCVVKPTSLGGGKGVTANIKSKAELAAAFNLARTYSTGALMVEKHLPGDDYRIVVIRGKMLLALRRVPSSIIGDGQSTVAQLIDKVNENRTRNLIKSRYLVRINNDATLHSHLNTQSVKLEDVLNAGQRVTLRSNANRSTGGVAFDVTNEIHPEIRAMAEQLSQSFGLAAAGMDYLTTDITKSPEEVDGGFIEANGTPGLCVCVAAGWEEKTLGKAVLGEKLGHIPVILTVVEKRELEKTRSTLHNANQESGHGWVCGNELSIGNVRGHQKHSMPWEAVRAALRNRTLKQLRIISTVEEIQIQGLPVARLEAVEQRDESLPKKWKAVIDGTISASG